jgi:hypothetical protein
MSLSKNKRTLVISIPKAGTYLAALLLEHIGLNDSHFHLKCDNSGIGFFDFRNIPLHISGSEKNTCFRPMPLIDSLKMIKNNGFAVGHLPPIPDVKELIYTDFKIIFLVRDLRDCLISHMRYMIKIGEIAVKEHPWVDIKNDKERFQQYLVNYADQVGPLVNMKLIACWEYDLRNPYPGMEIFKLRFEDLVNQDQYISAEVSRNLGGFLELEENLILDHRKIIESVIGKETRTYSGEKTIIDKYWTPFAEQWFQERIYDEQGNHLNEMLGYL